MGIRYDRDSRRATNGPLIFFSDASSEGAFAEEVRGAMVSGLSFYGYRSPNSPMVSFGSSEGYKIGIGEPGFVVGMFDPSFPYITIPYRNGKKEFTSQSFYTMPEESTTFEEYSEEVETAIKDLAGERNRKVVLSRVLIRKESLDIADKFFDLCERFPDSFVFCFSTPVTGCWIGASPELLLEGKPGILSTMALAGTRPSGSLDEWDEKNIEEQHIVVEYISKVFQENGFNPEIEATYTRQSGKIEHICTPISAERNDFRKEKLETLLKELSPTPALCGSPKQFAFEEIKKLEKFDRGCYGGFCGPFHSLEDFSFNVVLRCASVNERQYCIYAGGGITAKSDIDKEWEETEMKISNTFIRKR